MRAFFPLKSIPLNSISKSLFWLKKRGDDIFKLFLAAHTKWFCIYFFDFLRVRGYNLFFKLINIIQYFENINNPNMKSVDVITWIFHDKFYFNINPLKPFAIDVPIHKRFVILFLKSANIRVNKNTTWNIGFNPSKNYFSIIIRVVSRLNVIVVEQIRTH